MPFNQSFQDESYTCCIDECQHKVMILKDKYSLCEDLKYILSIPDLCDVTFLVGPEHYPVHGLRAILASRSRVFYQMILDKEKEINTLQSQKKLGFIKKLKQIRKFLKSKTSGQQLESSFSRKLSLPLEEYDPCVFERLIRYIHCGVVTVDVFTVMGLLVAAEKFEFECLQNACWEFAQSCIRPEVVHDLITSANQYPQSKAAKNLMQQIKEISVNNKEAVNYTPTRSHIFQDSSDSKQGNKRTNGLLMRTVL